MAVLAVSAAAGIAWAATGRERHEAVYPAQRIPIEFSHKTHLADGAPCESCHEPATTSVLATDVLVPKVAVDKNKKIPPHDTCDSCHDIEAAAAGKEVDPPAACDDCHLDYEKTKTIAKTSFPSANLVFNHQVHVKDQKLECEFCHFGSAGDGMKSVELSTRYQLPKMAVCLGCHNGAKAPADCKTCHITDPSGRLQVVFATAALRPMQGDPLGLDHGPRFELTHGTRAKIDGRTCRECHTESYCATCHDSLQKPISIHPNDFITLHPLQARGDSTACDSCHRYQSFCAACHERVGIGFNADPSLRARNLSVHGDRQEFVEAPGPKHHAIVAARDPKQCMACHREETCITCHASKSAVPSSRATNPHGDGFAGRCRALVQANKRGCLKCHSDADLQGKGCQ